MTERPKGTSPNIARIAGEGHPLVPPRPEVRLKERPVSSLSPAELLELKQYLYQQHINISQGKLQEGVVTVGYARFGVIRMVDKRIAFRPNQNNEIIIGTPQEFLEALKTVDETL